MDRLNLNLSMINYIFYMSGQETRKILRNRHGIDHVHGSELINDPDKAFAVDDHGRSSGI